MNKIIRIASVEAKLTTTGKTLIKIKDAENKSYQLWQVKQDGTETLAYQFYKTLPLQGIGRDVEISVEEKQGEYQGKPVTYRTILGMKPASQPSLGAQVARAGMAKDKLQAEDEKWDKISWGKCKHAYLVEAFKKYLQNPEADWNSIEAIAEKWADMSMRNTRAMSGTGHPDYPSEPAGHVEDEIKIEDIPF